MTLRELLAVCRYATGDPVEVELYDSRGIEFICTFSGEVESLKDYLLDAEVESFGPDEYKLEIVLKLEG